MPKSCRSKTREAPNKVSEGASKENNNTTDKSASSRSLRELSNKILLQITAKLQLKDLYSLFRTSHFFSELLMPQLRDFVLLDMGGLSALHWATRGGHERLVQRREMIPTSSC